MNTAADPVEAASILSDDQAQWDAATQIRAERPGWVVIWLARKVEFRARPLFPAPPGTVATGATPEELTARMDEIELAAGGPKHRARA